MTLYITCMSLHDIHYVPGIHSRDNAASQRSTMKVLIIGDSIINNLPKPVTGATVKCYRGGSIEDISKHIGHRDLLVSGYDHVILHVGTNNTWGNVERRSLAADMTSKMHILVGLIRLFNPTCKIAISSLLPRPRDAQKSDQLFQFLNDHLSTISGTRFINSYRRFQYGGKTLNDMFYDGLHLKYQSKQLLSDCFKQYLHHARR